MNKVKWPDGKCEKMCLEHLTQGKSPFMNNTKGNGNRATNFFMNRLKNGRLGRNQNQKMK